MTVIWGDDALEARDDFLAKALQRAVASSDAQIYLAALKRDEQIELEGDALDGPATYRVGPVPGTLLYPCRGGLYVMIYTRTGSTVEILWVAPSTSNWKP